MTAIEPPPVTPFEVAPIYPGLMAYTSTLRVAQDSARHYADNIVKGHVVADGERIRIIDDERELRYRKMAKSAALWLVFGFPLLWALAFMMFRAVTGFFR